MLVHDFCSASNADKFWICCIQYNSELSIWPLSIIIRYEFEYITILPDDLFRHKIHYNVRKIYDAYSTFRWLSASFQGVNYSECTVSEEYPHPVIIRSYLILLSTHSRSRLPLVQIVLKHRQYFIFKNIQKPG